MKQIQDKRYALVFAVILTLGLAMGLTSGSAYATGQPPGPGCVGPLCVISFRECREQCAELFKNAPPCPEGKGTRTGTCHISSERCDLSVGCSIKIEPDAGTEE